MAKTKSIVVDTKKVAKKKQKKESSLDIKVNSPRLQDDGNFSNSIVRNEVKTSGTITGNENVFDSAYHSVGLYTRNEIKNALYNKTFRFGYRDPNTLYTGREYLFFTRPDLHIIQVKEDLDKSTSDKIKLGAGLNSALASIPFWIDLYNSRKNTISALQASYKNKDDPFIHLLQNQVTSNLDIPELSAELIDTPVNNYGVGFSYRGSSEASDDGPEFSLEFKDNRYLDTYYFFKTYEEYETLKHHGVIMPAKKYITNRILHDQFAIYKFIVDEDMETIIYYGKMYGVMPKSLPRDVFSNPTFDNGLSYSISFKAAFYEEMKPDILSDFNKLSGPLYNKQKYQINPFNQVLDRADMRPAKAAAVVVDRTSAAAINSPTGYLYKLKWRGSDTK